MLKKTDEQRREANRARQAKWRASHKWLGEQRRLETYGKSKVQIQTARRLETLENNMERVKRALESVGLWD